jgi:hypothetical protein
LKVRCRWRGLSVEPMLGAVDLERWLNPQVDCHFNGDPEALKDAKFAGAFSRLIQAAVREIAGIHWVIAGGCSGTDPANVVPHPSWFRTLRDQCQAAGVPFFFKQWGNHVPQGNEALAGYDDDKGLRYHHHDDGTLMLRLGADKAGASLDGREWRQMPRLSCSLPANNCI